jgi:hypothetical protein
MATAATLDNLFVFADNKISTATTFTVNVAGLATALTCTVAVMGVSCSDTTHTVPIAAGNTVAVQVSNTSTGVTMHFRIRYQ